MQNMMSSYLKIKKLVEEEESDSTEEEDEEEEVDREEERKFVGPQLKKKKKKKKKKMSLGEGSGRSTGKPAGGAAVARPSWHCLVQNCGADLNGSKKYHQRHRVCEVHAKAPVVLVDGLRQRFCQQCSRFHELSEFDQTKRSCRRRLAGHNERRRKSSIDSQKEGPSGRLMENHCKDLTGNQNFQIHRSH